MKQKFSDVYKKIRFAKLDPKHEKAGKTSTDDEEHYAVDSQEFAQQVAHIKKRAMQEEKKDKYDEGEYDREGDMAKSDLRSIIANAQKLHDMMNDADNLPEWVQSKITVAEDYISTVANYMTAEMNEEYVTESGGKMLMKKGDYHIEKYGEDAFALYHKGKKQKYYSSMADAKSAMKEQTEYLEEKNKPTNPELWSRAIAMAKSKFDVYPSAYANGWASKWYKSKGGGWETVKEETKLDEISQQTKSSYSQKAKQQVAELKPYSKGEYGDIAKKMISRRQKGIKMAKIKEQIDFNEEVEVVFSESRKTDIIRQAYKDKKKKQEKFEAEPVISSTVVKADTSATGQ